MNKTGLAVLIIAALLIGGAYYLFINSPKSCGCKGNCTCGKKGNSTTRNQDLSFIGGYPTNYDYYSYQS